MRTPTSLSLLALLATAGSVIAQNDTDDLPFDIDFDIPEFPEFQCAEGLQVFISRGTGEEQGPGESGKLGEAIADRIPGTNITSNPYPATFDDPIYFESVLFGTLALGVMLTAYVTACPDSKIAVIGYSQVDSSHLPPCRRFVAHTHNRVRKSLRTTSVVLPRSGVEMSLCLGTPWRRVVSYPRPCPIVLLANIGLSQSSLSLCSATLHSRPMMNSAEAQAKAMG